MKKFDNYLIGQVTVDRERFQDGPIERLVGGPVVFSGYACVGSGRRVGCVTKMAPEDRHLLQLLYLHDVTCISSRETTGVLAVYHTIDRERRDLYVDGQADPITVDDIPQDITSEVYQLAGILNGQVDNALFAYLAQRGKVACDLQGYLRETKDGMVVVRDWADKRTYLPYVTYLKADAQEAEIATGCSDRREAAKILYGYGAKEILITHNTEALVYDGRDFYTCPLRPRNLSGRSGRGDNTFGSYITERINKSIPDALLYASALVSLKMEHYGPFKATRQDVLKYAETFYPDYRFKDPT